MRLEYALGLSLNIHVPRGENWTARSMGLGEGGGYLRLGGREAQKQSWQEFLSFSLAGATVTLHQLKCHRLRVNSGS